MELKYSNSNSNNNNNNNKFELDEDILSIAKSFEQYSQLILGRIPSQPVVIQKCCFGLVLASIYFIKYELFSLPMDKENSSNNNNNGKVKEKVEKIEKIEKVKEKKETKKEREAREAKEEKEREEREKEHQLALKNIPPAELYKHHMEQTQKIQKQQIAELNGSPDGSDISNGSNGGKNGNNNRSSGNDKNYFVNHAILLILLLIGYNDVGLLGIAIKEYDGLKSTNQILTKLYEKINSNFQIIIENYLIPLTKENNPFGGFQGSIDKSSAIKKEQEQQQKKTVKKQKNIIKRNKGSIINNNNNNNTTIPTTIPTK
ncbi:hypothetical protein ACTA71_006456 [Dictyostelium dimigraforme]